MSTVTVSRLRLDLDRNDLVAKNAVVNGGQSALMGAQRPGVLLLPVDTELSSDVIAVQPHLHTVQRAKQPVDDHHVLEDAIAHPIAIAGVADKVGRMRHALHAARHHDRVHAGANLQIGELIARMPEPQTRLIVSAVTVLSSPARNAACRAGIWPTPP